MMDYGEWAYFEGRIVPIDEAKISVMTHAFNYGTAIFEGIRGYWNKEDEQLYIFRLREHVVRMLRNCNILMIRPKLAAPESSRPTRISGRLRTRAHGNWFRASTTSRTILLFTRSGSAITLTSAPGCASVYRAGDGCGTTHYRLAARSAGRTSTPRWRLRKPGWPGSTKGYFSVKTVP